MPDLNERFILAEDEALKRKFEGLSVTYPNPRNVDVWFRWPNKEVREVTHPFIAVELVDMQKSDRREHSGDRFELDYAPVGFPTTTTYNNDTTAITADEWPTPYDLIYSITVASLDPRHDRELKYKILGDRHRLPHRWAYLDIPDDDTVRRLDVLGIETMSSRATDVNTFYTVFTVRVESELFPGEVREVIRVTGVNLIAITDTTSGFREEYPA